MSLIYVGTVFDALTITSAKIAAYASHLVRAEADKADNNGEDEGNK